MSEVIWKRPQGCTCQSSEETDPTGQLVVTRVTDPTCLVHGDNASKIDEAIKAIMTYGRTTPNATAFNEPNVRRLIHYIAPILLNDTNK